MLPFLDFSLKDSRSGWFVVVGDLQDVGGIDVMIVAPTHNMISIDVELEHWHLKEYSKHSSLSDGRAFREGIAYSAVCRRKDAICTCTWTHCDSPFHAVTAATRNPQERDNSHNHER